MAVTCGAAVLVLTVWRSFALGRYGAAAPLLVAVELSGELRTLERVLPSWKRHLFPALGTYDIYAACNGGAELQRARALLASAGARAVAMGVRDERPAAAAASLFGEASRVIPAPDSAERRPVRGWLLQLAGVFSASTLRLSTQRQRGAMMRPYDAVLRLRFDLEVLAPIPPLGRLAPNALFVPTEHAHGGVNDKFAVGHPRAMRTYATLVRALGRVISPEEGYPLPDGLIQAERCLAAHLRRAGLDVRHHPGIQVRVRRLDGSLSDTRR